MSSPNRSNQPKPSGTRVPAGAPIPNDLVQKVADKVYTLLLAELRLEAERRRISPGRGKGGR